MTAKRAASSRHDRAPLQSIAVLGALIVVVTVIAYGPLFGNGFINFDDPLYVTENPIVRAGLSWPGIKGAFTHTAVSHWQPVTVLSHELDVELFGFNPAGHHAMSLALHCANAVLLLVLLIRMTGALYPSALVAALFALHPQHVESVAWVSGRKDLVSTLFMIAALLAYRRYVQQRTKARYAMAGALFLLGLMAKSMLMTLPFLLLLLDYWPFRRIDFAKPAWREAGLRLVMEKVPFLALSILFAVLSVITQGSGGALRSTESIPVYARVTNAIVSYGNYALGIVWPCPLAIFYPLNGAPPIWKVLIAAAFLLLVSMLAIRRLRASPYVIVGWLWFLGALVPVIGLVQVGTQSMADRYTYITTIGLFIIIAWGVFTPLMAKYPRAAIAASLLALAGYGAVTMRYTAQWENSETIFRHALNVTTDNHMANLNLGVALAAAGRYQEALPHYEEAVRIQPRSVKAQFNLGNAYYHLKDYSHAADAFAHGVALAPESAYGHARLGLCLSLLGKRDEAIAEMQRTLQLDPQYPYAKEYLKKLKDGATLGPAE